MKICKKSLFFVIAASLLVLFATCVIAEINIAGTKKSSVAVSTFIHQSKGAADADRATIVAQKTKIRKHAASQTVKTNATAKTKAAAPAIDPSKAPDMLTEIDKQKLGHYQIINDTLEEQKTVYKAMAKNKADQAMIDKFNGDVDNSRASLKELRKLTDEQINIYRATTNDAQAIKVANSTYYTWENAVGALNYNPIDDAALDQLDKDIHANATDAVTGANAQAQSVNVDEVDAADQTVVKDEILKDGANVQTGLSNTMKELGSVFGDIIKVLKFASGQSDSGKAVRVIAGLFGTNVPTLNIDPNLLNILELSFNLMATQVSSFNDSFSGFMQSTGGMAGVQVQQAKALEVPNFEANSKK